MGGKTSTTQQQVTIPKEVMDRYNAVNRRAEGLADTPFQQYSTDPSAFVAQINAQQQGGFDTINNASGSYQPYLAKATDMVAAGSGSAQPRALNLDQFYNPFQSQVIDATMKQMGQANEQAQSGALGTAISSGAFGGDRAGIAAANLANQQNLAMGSTLAGLNSQNYQQALQAAMQQQGLYLGADQADLARKMQAGQMYAGLGSQALQSGLAAGEAQINAGTLEQQTEQAGKSALYNQFQQQQAYPFQIAQFLANIAMGTGALSGSTTTTTQPSSFWSDRRLKTDIKRVGTADNGLPVYTFKYKGDDAEQTHVGYMADEVEKLHPEAVGVAGNGYKFVDYDRASRAQGGGVAGPYGIQAGSQDPYAAGYVPQAYLPVGELMMADPALLDQANNTLAQQLDAMNRFGESVSGLKDKYDAVRDWWRGDEPASEQGQADPAKQWRGGVVGYADGGAAYLSARGGLNPVDTKTYLSDTLEDQRKRDDEVMRPASAPSQGKSGFENVLDAGKMAMTLFGFERGGVAGRHGYATDGAVDDEERQRRLREVLSGEAGAATSALPSGVVPSPDRISRPVSYDVQPTGEFLPVRTPMGTSGSYNPNTGLVRDSAGNYVTGESGDALRGILTGAQDQERAGLAAAMRNTVEQQSAYPTAENTQAMEQARKDYLNATAIPTADEARAAYVPPSEIAMRPVSAPQGGLIPAAGTPLPPSGGLIPAAGTPLSAAPPSGAPAAPQGVIGPQPAPKAGEPIPLVGGVADGTVPAIGWKYSAPNIIQRESGGDFDALYGHAQREGGPFAGVKVTNMTVDQAIDFARPDGAYADWVRGQIGRTATPMGGLQIVGTTLRDVKEGMGLRGDEVMTPELQMKMGEWLYKNRGGTKPWAASEGAAGGVGGAPANMNRSPAGGLVPTGYGIGGDKPWEERTTLGKMFYNEDGSVNKNALLSILSGIGAMASSPSRYLGASILQGIGGAANTYAGLQKQAADIGLTNAQARRESIAADRERIYEGANGVMFINFGDGRPPVELWDYIENPEAYSTGNAALDAQIRREAQAVAAKTPQPAGIFSDPSVQMLLDRETANSQRNPNAARAQSDAIESAATASAAAARSSIPSILTQADAVSALTSPDAEVRAGALGPVKQTVTNYLNDISQTLSQMTGTQLPVISDPNGGDAATNAQIILKEAVAAGMINASGIQELQTIMSAQPNVALTAEANSALMAGLLVSGRADMRRADFMRDYKAQPGNTYRTVIDAGQAFQEAYGDQILAEKAALKELIHYGSQPMPPEWAAILGDYKTPMEFLMTPGIPAEDKSAFIMKLLPYMGVNERVIAALNGPDGAYIGNYFGG